MALVDETLELADKMKVVAAAQAWFVKSDILHYSDVAVMAAKEGDVNAEIIDVMIAEGVNEMKAAGAKVNVKKFWVACRDQYEMDRRPERDASVVIDAPIPVPEDTDIVAKWKARHNFILPDSQLLIPNHQGKLWRDFNMSQPQISKWLAETLRTRSCVHKAIGHQLSLVPGKPAETIEVIADSIDKAFELFVRIRAFFQTLSYVSITT